MKKTNKTDIPALIALSMLFTYDAKAFNRVLDDFDEPRDFFNPERYPEYRERYGLTMPITTHILERAGALYDELRASGIQFTVRGDDAFPRRMADCPADNLPPFLYVRSATPVKDLFNRKRVSAVIGTRDCSAYGVQLARDIVSSLHEETRGEGLLVSGFAMGISVAAHRKALELGMPTVAVLPTGIDDVYPSTFREIAEQIAGTPGCALVSSYPPKTAPLALNFMLRNGIIAALCDETVVVETKTRGGGVLTARIAADYGRKVYAVPGRVDDMRSKGCNQLIREGTATILADTEQLG